MSIGNPVSLTSQVASKTISIIATASQTAFTVTGGYRINQLAVFRNGIRLVDSRDYEARDGATVTLLSAASEGDAVEFQVFDAFQVADTINPYSTYQTIDGNLNITGIITAATFSVTDLDVRNITGVAATFTGQVTYEDVTNVDSIGIITARSHVSIADSILHTGDTDTSIRFPANDTFTVETAGSERVRITSAGRVGIGTDSPDCKLEISNDGYAFPSPAGSSHFRVGNGGGSSTIDISAANTQISGIYFSDTDAVARGVVGYLHNGNYLYFGTNDGTERVRILSGGQVNIGGNYTQTTYTMQVTGTINATSNITQNGNALATNGKAIAMALIFG